MSAKGSITTADFLPFNEYQRLVHSLENDKQYQWALYCTLQFCLGLRVSDVIKLKWSDILNEDCIVMEEKKTKKVKKIPIGKAAKERIEKSWELMHFPLQTDYIFRSEKQNIPVSRQYLNRILKNWKDKYKLAINNFSTHTFRKTFGRYVYESKGRTEEALIILMRIFRHSDLRTTMIYIGLTDEEVGDVFSSINI